MKILFIAPIPPPINGQSKASKVLLEALAEKNEVEIINLSKESLKNGVNSINRIFEIVRVFSEVKKRLSGKDIIYISLAESFVGNLRDIFIYALARRQLNNTYIHMLGGAGMKKILSGSGTMQKINAFFMKKLAGVIVEGPVNFEIFKKVIPVEKIHIVPNFAEDFLFVSDEEIAKKFEDTSVIKILYLSNLIPGKGYEELAEAFIALPTTLKARIKLTFVGGFESNESQERFVKTIEPHKGIEYLGKFIDGEEKRKLYCETHVFCLPTYYPFEGQPISILEAYATGCVVIASNHSGIPYIFKNNVNGFLTEPRSVLSLQDALTRMLDEQKQLVDIALNNRNTAAKQYRTKIFQDKILNILKPNNVLA